MPTPIGGQPVNPDITAFSAQNAEQLQQALFQFGVIKDSMAEVADQFGPIKPPGFGSAGKPILAPPNPNASTRIPGKENPKPTPEEVYTKSFDKFLNEQTIAKNLSEQELKNLEFLKNNPGVSLDDSKMQAKLEGVLKEINANVQGETGLLKPPDTIKKDYQDAIAKKFDEKFEAELAKSGLSEEDAAKVRFAHYNPGSKVEPKIQMALENTEKAAIESMKSEGMIVPAGWRPPTDTEGFNIDVSQQFSDAMEASIKALGAAKGLSEQEINGLIHSFYNPSGKVPDLVADATEMVMQTLGPNLGLPAVPSPNTFGYQALLRGDFQGQFNQNLSDMPLTTEQLAAVRAALADPALMTPETKAIIDAAFNLATKLIQQKYGLPSSWVTDATFADLGKSSPLLNTLNQAEATINASMKQIGTMPPGVEKDNYMNFLKEVADAIAELKKTISLMQGLDSKMGMQASRVRLDKAMEKAQKKADNLAEINKKLAKVGQMKAVGPAMKALVIAILWALAAATMWIAGLGAIFVALVVTIMVLFTVFAIADEAIKNDPSVSADAKKAIGIMGMITEILATIVLTIATMGAGTAALAGAKVAMESAKAAGQSAVKAVMQSLLKSFIESLKQLPSKLMDGLKNLPKAVQESTKLGKITAVGEIFQAVPEIVKSSTDASKYAQQAEIALLRGDMEAFEALMKTLIKLLQKLVSSLLGNVNDLGDWLKTVGEMETSRIGGMEKSLNNIRS